MRVLVSLTAVVCDARQGRFSGLAVVQKYILLAVRVVRNHVGGGT